MFHLPVFPLTMTARAHTDGIAIQCLCEYITSLLRIIPRWYVENSSYLTFKYIYHNKPHCSGVRLWIIHTKTSLVQCETLHYLFHDRRFDSWDNTRADSRFAPSQWETALLCNNVSHCLDTNLGSALQHVGPVVQINITLAEMTRNVSGTKIKKNPKWPPQNSTMFIGILVHCDNIFGCRWQFH